MDHHCAEVAWVGHDVVRCFLCNAFVLSEFEIGIGIILAQLTCCGVDYGCLIEFQPEFDDFPFYLLGIPQQRDSYDVAQQKQFARLEDAGLFALGHHDVLALCLCSLDQIVFEHERCYTA